MAYVSVEQIKAHCNIDPSFHTDDNLLKDYEQVAEKAVANYIHRDLTDYVTDGELDECLCQAIKFYTATLYANRESVSYTNAVQTPQSWDFLLQPYCKYDGIVNN